MTPAEAAKLNLAVAKADGINAMKADGRCYLDIYYQPDRIPYEPLTNGNLIVALMEKYKISLGCLSNGQWWKAFVLKPYVRDAEGPTIGEAVCRCVVAIHGKTTGAS